MVFISAIYYVSCYSFLCFCWFSTVIVFNNLLWLRHPYWANDSSWKILYSVKSKPCSSCIGPTWVWQVWLQVIIDHGVLVEASACSQGSSHILSRAPSGVPTLAYIIYIKQAQRISHSGFRNASPPQTTSSFACTLPYPRYHTHRWQRVPYSLCYTWATCATSLWEVDPTISSAYKFRSG